MNVITYPSSLGNAESHPDRPSDAAIERHINGIRKALVIERQIVTIGDLTLRFLRRDEIFEHEGTEYQALEPGLFQLAKWTRGGGGESAEEGTRWLHYTSSDDLEAVVTPRLKAMSKIEAESLSIGFAANKVLREITSRRRSMTP
jgi:hypothetical protein